MEIHQHGLQGHHQGFYLASIRLQAVGGGMQLPQHPDGILERIAVEHADRFRLQCSAHKRVPPLETLVNEARGRVALEERLTGGLSRRMERATDIERCSGWCSRTRWTSRRSACKREASHEAVVVLPDPGSPSTKISLVSRMGCSAIKVQR